MDISEVGKPTGPEVSALVTQEVAAGRRIGERSGIKEADSRLRLIGFVRVIGFVEHIGTHQVKVAAPQVVDTVNAGGTRLEAFRHVHDVPGARAAALRGETVIHRAAVNHAVHVARSGNDKSALGIAALDTLQAKALTEVASPCVQKG